MGTRMEEDEELELQGGPEADWLGAGEAMAEASIDQGNYTINVLDTRSLFVR